MPREPQAFSHSCHVMPSAAPLAGSLCPTAYPCNTAEAADTWQNWELPGAFCLSKVTWQHMLVLAHHVLEMAVTRFCFPSQWLLSTWSHHVIPPIPLAVPVCFCSYFRGTSMALTQTIKLACNGKYTICCSKTHTHLLIWYPAHHTIIEAFLQKYRLKGCNSTLQRCYSRQRKGAFHCIHYTW